MVQIERPEGGNGAGHPIYWEGAQAPSKAEAETEGSIRSKLLKAKHDLEEKGCQEMVGKVTTVKPEECENMKFILDTVLPNTEVTMPRVLRKMNQTLNSKEAESRARLAVHDALSLTYWLVMDGAFDKMDLNHDESIAEKELDTALYVSKTPWYHKDQMFPIMDRSGDGALSREEVHHYLRSAIMLRQVVPEVDQTEKVAGKIETKQALYLAHMHSNKQVVLRRLAFGIKLVVILAIPIGAFILHSVLCHTVPKMISKQPGAVPPAA